MHHFWFRWYPGAHVRSDFVETAWLDCDNSSLRPPSNDCIRSNVRSKLERSRLLSPRTLRICCAFSDRWGLLSKQSTITNSDGCVVPRCRVTSQQRATSCGPSPWMRALFGCLAAIVLLLSGWKMRLEEKKSQDPKQYL